MFKTIRNQFMSVFVIELKQNCVVTGFYCHTSRNMCFPV